MSCRVVVSLQTYCLPHTYTCSQAFPPSSFWLEREGLVHDVSVYQGRERGRGVPNRKNAFHACILHFEPGVVHGGNEATYMAHTLFCIPLTLTQQHGCTLHTQCSKSSVSVHWRWLWETARSGSCNVCIYLLWMRASSCVDKLENTEATDISFSLSWKAR